MSLKKASTFDVDNPQPGAYEGVPDAEYFAANALNHSSLKEIGKSPAHFKAAIETPSESTPAMRLGTACHVATLESDRFQSVYGRVPPGDGRTKAVRDAKKEIAESGREALTAVEHDTAVGVACAAQAHPIFGGLLSAKTSSSEVAIVWHEDVGGVKTLCKARLDLLGTIKGVAVIADLKTTSDYASPTAAARRAANLSYATAAAFYLRGARAAGLGDAWFLTYFAETRPPFAGALYEYDRQALDFGSTLVDRWLATHAACVDTDEWPGYTQTIETLSLPVWQINERT